MLFSGPPLSNLPCALAVLEPLRTTPLCATHSFRSKAEREAEYQTETGERISLGSFQESSAKMDAALLQSIQKGKGLKSECESTKEQKCRPRRCAEHSFRRSLTDRDTDQ